MLLNEIDETEKGKGFTPPLAAVHAARCQRFHAPLFKKLSSNCKRLKQSSSWRGSSKQQARQLWIFIFP
jgi:hypothetical protein